MIFIIAFRRAAAAFRFELSATPRCFHCAEPRRATFALRREPLAAAAAREPPFSSLIFRISATLFSYAEAIDSFCAFHIAHAAGAAVTPPAPPPL
jgi:hypothetical protein